MTVTMKILDRVYENQDPTKLWMRLFSEDIDYDSFFGRLSEVGEVYIYSLSVKEDGLPQLVHMEVEQ